MTITHINLSEYLTDTFMPDVRLFRDRDGTYGISVVGYDIEISEDVGQLPIFSELRKGAVAEKVSGAIQVALTKWCREFLAKEVSGADREKAGEGQAREDPAGLRESSPASETSGEGRSRLATEGSHGESRERTLQLCPDETPGPAGS
jgi:hypothetical protein